MALTEEQKKKIEEEEAYRAKIREESKSQPSKKGCGGCVVAILVIVGLLTVTLISINPAQQFEQAEEALSAHIGKHAYNKASGAYRGEVLEVKPCNTTPALMCFVVNQPTFMRPIEAPVDNSIIRNEAPTPTEQP